MGGFIIKKIASIEENREKSTIDFAPPAHEDLKLTSASDGKRLFLGKCAACHHVFKEGTGPALSGFEERGSWSDREKLYEWIRNPLAFMKKDPYTKNLKVKYGSVMTAFPDLTNAEVDAIVEYINQSGKSRILPIAKR